MSDFNLYPTKHEREVRKLTNQLEIGELKIQRKIQKLEYARLRRMRIGGLFVDMYEYSCKIIYVITKYIKQTIPLVADIINFLVVWAKNVLPKIFKTITSVLEVLFLFISKILTIGHGFLTSKELRAKIIHHTFSKRKATDQNLKN